MKRTKKLKNKIIFYVMAVSILLAACIVKVMSEGSIRSTNAIVLDNMQITARIAAQDISANLHLLTERMHDLALEDVFSNPDSTMDDKQARLTTASLQIEFVWLSAYDVNGNKLFGDEIAPASISETAYYADLTQTQNIVIGDPYYENDVVQLCVGAPFKEGDEVTGYLIGSYKYDVLNDVLSLLILGDTGSSFLLNEDGRVIGDVNLQNIIDNKTYQDIFPASKNDSLWEDILCAQTGSALMKLDKYRYYVGYTPVPGTNWTLFIHAPQREFLGTVIRTLEFCIAGSVVLLLLAMIIIIPVASKTSRSLSSATVRLQALANGNLTDEVLPSKTNDETRILTQALSQTITSLNNYIQAIQSSLGSLSNGDYTIQIPDNFTGDFTSIRDSLINITNSLNQTMQKMNQSSIDVNRNSNKVSDFAQRLNDGAANQSALLEELDRNMSAITASIEKNKDNVLQMETCSENAEEKTSLGNKHMQSMLKSMEQIHDAVDEISKISRMVEKISLQTNLLSFNASIEASRAGEAGKGFAVVAQEIGQLSTQTADALQQTGTIISDAVTIIEKGLHTAEETATAFQEIREVSRQYLEISNQLSDTVSEQTSSVSYVNRNLDSLKEINDANQVLAEETSKMAASSLEQSESLKQYVSQVKLKTTN